MGAAPIVSFDTSLGPVSFELYVNEAPRTVRNFEGLIERGYYNGTIFHRVIKNFMTQAGDPTGAGILSMANAGPNTNGSQFFVTLSPTPWLDGKHTIFGRVCAGMGVMKKMNNLPTDANDRPTMEVKVLRAYSGPIRAGNSGNMLTAGRSDGAIMNMVR